MPPDRQHQFQTYTQFIRTFNGAPRMNVRMNSHLHDHQRETAMPRTIDIARLPRQLFINVVSAVPKNIALTIVTLATAT